MLNFILYYILFALFTFIAATVAAFVYLEWWQAILASFFTFFALIWFGKLFVRYRVRRFGSMFQEMFLMKSRVLHGATIEVHSVTRASQPERPLLPPGESEADEEDEGGDEPNFDDDESDDESGSIDDDEAQDEQSGPRDYFCVDVSIIPGRAKGPMQHWDLGDLRLVDVCTRVPAGLQDEGMDDINDFDLEELEIEAGGKFVLEEGMKYEGRQRLRFLVGVPEGVRELKFHYYFEEFGRVPLPGR